jgi:hypothetical protein
MVRADRPEVIAAAGQIKNQSWVNRDWRCLQTASELRE